MRAKVGFSAQEHSSTDLYIHSRFYLQLAHGSRFMFTDLWWYNIPTFEEYGQWVTKPLAVFSREMLAGQAERDRFRYPTDPRLLAQFRDPEVANRYELDRQLVFGPSFTNAYRADLKVLRVLGARFLVTDAALGDPGLKLRHVLEVAPGAPPAVPEAVMYVRGQGKVLEGAPVPVRLYEIADPNLGNYSPVHFVQATTTQAIVERLRALDFSFRDEAVVAETLPDLPARALQARMEPVRGGVRISARSDGPAALLLPLQYSRCLKLHGATPSGAGAPPRLLRANLIQTLVLFERELDAEIRFDFGLWPSDSGCRALDVADYDRLDFSAWRYVPVRTQLLNTR